MRSITALFASPGSVSTMGWRMPTEDAISERRGAHAEVELDGGEIVDGGHVRKPSAASRSRRLMAGSSINLPS
jgi:hypothetical protein